MEEAQKLTIEDAIKLIQNGADEDEVVQNLVEAELEELLGKPVTEEVEQQPAQPEPPPRQTTPPAPQRLTRQKVAEKVAGLRLSWDRR